MSLRRFADGDLLASEGKILQQVNIGIIPGLSAVRAGVDVGIDVMNTVL